VSLKERLKSVSSQGADDRRLFERFGVVQNPFPSASQSTNNPHRRSKADDAIEMKIERFIRDRHSQVIVIEGTQGVGKTNILNYYEKEIADALASVDGFYVIRYLADPEAFFDGILRRLFQELGSAHLIRLGRSLAENKNSDAIEIARNHEMRVALQRLKRSGGDQGVVDAFMEWLLGLRVLNRHRDLLGVQFRLDTVESKTQALRDLVFVSSEIGILNGIFLLLDELEKQDGVPSATLVVRYLSAIRAIIDALPNHLFMMIAITPDSLRRYSLALPAFRSRLQDTIALSPLTDVNEALSLATFYMDEAKVAAEHEKKTNAPKRRILSVDAIRKTFDDGLSAAKRRGDGGLRQREFLHALHLV
jgi:P-loop Domain of unknown function (DUF2791)